MAKDNKYITLAYVNEVIKDISEKNAGTLNIIMTDEMMPDVHYESITGADDQGLNLKVLGTLTPP